VVVVTVKIVIGIVQVVVKIVKKDGLGWANSKKWLGLVVRIVKKMVWLEMDNYDK